MGPYGYGYPQQDPLAEMDYMQPRPPQFAPMQPPSLMQPPQQQQGGGLLSSLLGSGGGSGGGGLSSLFGGGGGGGMLGKAMSLFGGGTGGANVGDVAHNFLGGLMNPSNDPFGLAGKNAAAGLTSPELTGEEMTSLVGGNGVGSGVASSSALDGAAGSSGAGGLSGLFGGGSGGGGLGGAGPAGLFAALIGLGKNTEANHPNTAMGKGLLGLLGPSISQVVKDPMGMGLPTLLGAPFLTPFTSSKESQATKPEWSGLFNMGF